MGLFSGTKRITKTPQPPPRPSNAAARRLYRSMGFAEVGISRGYYPARGGREDAVILALALS